MGAPLLEGVPVGVPLALRAPVFEGVRLGLEPAVKDAVGELDALAML